MTPDSVFKFPAETYVIMTKKNEVVYVRHNLLAAKRYATKRGYVRIGELDADGYLKRVWWKGYRSYPKKNGVSIYGPAKGVYSSKWDWFRPGKVKPVWRK